MRVLVVDDNRDAVANISEYLELKGHEIDVAYHGDAALTLLDSFSFDAIVLDVMMPYKDGLQTCQAIRSSIHADTPIIFVTARDSLEDKLAGFAAGGDDYIVKPFELAELNARLEVMYARSVGTRSSQISFSGVKLDSTNQQVWIEGHEISLDPTQFKILKILLNSAPNLVQQTDLAHQLWQDELVETSSLRTHIYRLRKLLPDGLLVTVRGKGYRLHDVQGIEQ